MPSPPTRRRARPNLPAIFSRSALFRYPRRRAPPPTPTVYATPALHSPTPDLARLSASSPLLVRHRNRRQSPPQPPPKPIYIYPGLLRIVRDKAIALDNQCPAVLYKCRDCRRQNPSAPARSDPPLVEGLPSVEQDLPPQQMPSCPHQTACPICLDEFHGKDLVRKLPCNPTHVFHSKCILDWFVSHHRCPLCNESVSNVPPARRSHPPRRISDPDLAARQLPLSPPGTTSAPAPPSHSRERPHGSVHLRRDNDSPRQKSSSTDKGRKRRGPRTYSYIVHDNVRMEMNPYIPV